MPNWCQNLITITGLKEDLITFKQAVRSDDRDFDFNTLIPMPKELDVTHDSVTEKAYLFMYGSAAQITRYASTPVSSGDVQAFNAKTRANEALMSAVEQYKYNKDHYGCITWYEWCPENWDTKWNACDTNIEEIKEIENGQYSLEIFFKTAWSCPKAIYHVIASRYPELRFHAEIDEEGGYFYGAVDIVEGVVTFDFKTGIRQGGPYDYYEDDEDEEN